MNLLDKASIILTASAYNNGEALCVKPSDGSGDFDFSRNSAATRVNAQGLVEDVQILSSNLVQNGDFSEQGAEEVSNGSFSQQGSELIVNGDFSVSTGWQGLNANRVISEGKLNINMTSGFAVVYQPEILSVGTFYKCTVEVSNYVDGGFKIGLAGSDAANTSPNINADGTFTFYLQRVSGGSNNIGFVFDGLTNLSIDNCSIVEVGQDWNLGANWSISEDKIVSNASGLLQQSTSELITGKTYKTSFEITEYTSGGVKLYSGSGSDTPGYQNTLGTHVVYFVANGNTTSLYSDNFIGSITNISVKEVGQNWYLGTGWEIGNNVAISDTTASNLTPSTTLVSGEKYKFTLDVAKITSGNFAFLLRFNGTNTTIATINTEGSFTFYATADATGFRLQNLSGGTADFSVTNITAVQITDDTNLPRISYENFSYQDALGSEEVLNGTFDTGSNWAFAGGSPPSIINEKLVLIGDTYNSIASNTGASVVSGKTYKVSFDITDYTSGGATVRLGGVFGVSKSGLGTHTQYIVSDGTSIRIYTAENNTQLSIDNVSVKEYLGQEVVPDSGCGHWLWEPQSTNLVTQSELFSDSSWVKLGAGTGSVAIVTSNYAISPDGTLNASRLQCDLNSGGSSSSNQSLIYDIYSSSGNQTISIYVKSNNGQNQTIYFANTQTSGDTIIVTPEWQRFTFSHSVSTYIIAVGLRGRSVGAIDDTADILLFAAQAEEQSYATSYIPTDGTSVTRNQDVCNNGGSVSTINSTEGVLYFEGLFLGPGYRFITLNSGSANRVSIYSNSPTTISFNARVGGANQFNGNYSIDATINHKVALKYKENDFALWIDGIEVATDKNGITFATDTLNEFSFDDGNGGSKFFGKTKAVAVFPFLTDTELQELTTI